MTADGNSAGERRRSGLDRAISAVGLVVLLAVAATRLDRSELSAAEGVHAQAALGPIENDRRGVPAASPWDGPYASWRGGAYVVGTTERSLRLPVMLGLLLAAAVLAEAVVRLAPSASRGTVWLLCAASPFLHRTDLLHPGLLGALPAALLIGGAVHARGGSAWWLPGAALGGAGLVAADPRATPLAAAGVLAAALGAVRLSRAVILVAVAGGAVSVAAFAAGWPEVAPPDPETDIAASGRGFLSGWPWLVLGGAPWAAAACRAATRRAAAAFAAAGVGLGAATRALLPDAPVESWTGHGLVLVLAASLFTAALEAGFRRGFALAALLLALAAGVPEFRRIAGYDAGGAEADSDPVRGLLAEARGVSVSGGRLVVAGPDRRTVPFYVRRGHDPGVPVLLVPEDVAEDGLAALLRHQFRAAPGTEARLPPILYRPPPGTPAPPPGLALVETPDPGLRRLVGLRLLPEPAR